MLTIPTRDELSAERCRRSLRRYVEEAWPFVEPGRPFVSNWHIDVLCDALEAVTRREIRKLVINVPPRHMKSLAVSVFWPTWVWLSDPGSRWLVASHTQRFVTRDSARARRILQSPGTTGHAQTLLQRVGYRGLVRLLGDSWEFMPDQNLKTRYENSRTGYRMSTSFGSKEITGEGGDYRVVDDPHNPQAVRSETERQNDLDWFDETWSSRGMNPATDVQVAIMQRLHELDLTGHLLERGDWEHICLPAEYEPKHPFVWPEDPRTEPGEILWQPRIMQDFLDGEKVALGSYGYAGQYQQRPAPGEGGIFKREWWQQSGAFQAKRIAQSWDCAFKDTDGTDYVVGQLWACDQADRHLIGQIRARLAFTETCTALEAMTAFALELYPQLSAHSIYVEDKANGSAVIDTFKRKLQGVTAVTPKESKEARAHAVTPQIEAGNVYLPRGRIACPAAPARPDGSPLWRPSTAQDVIEECAGFPNGAHDDQVDALTQALNKLREPGGAKIRVGAQARLRG